MVNRSISVVLPVSRKRRWPGLQLTGSTASLPDMGESDCVNRGVCCQRCERWTSCCDQSVGTRTSYSASVDTLPPCYSSQKRRMAIGSYSRPDVRHPSSVTATDQQLVQALAEEMHEDFAISGVTKFCVAYLARRVTVIKPLDPNSSMRPSTTKRRGVVIELHSAEAQARIFREIVHCGGKCLLGAPETLDEPITASPYFDLLPRAIASSDGVVTVH